MLANTRVLLVEADPDERELLGSWLEGAGYEVTTCPGPCAPTYVCVGDRKGTCPLLEESDVVVLVSRLQSEDALEGTSAADLLSLYVCSGRPVVAVEASHLSHLFREEDVVFLSEGTEGGLVGAVDELLKA